MQTSPSEISPGFSNAVVDASNCFRAVLEAMSQPAQSIRFPAKLDNSHILNEGALAILLTLCDVDTAIYLAPEYNSSAVKDYLRFHTGCVITKNPADAIFAVLGAQSDLDICDHLPHGSDDYPNRSATVIFLCDDIENGVGPNFSGPGIKDKRHFSVTPMPDFLWDKVILNHTFFPRGLDWVFASPSHIAALPRTTKLEPTLCM